MPDNPPVISGEEIINETMSDNNSDVSLTPLQALGGKILSFIGFFSVIALFLILIPWIQNVPTPPTIPVIDATASTQVVDNTQKMLDFYKLQNEIAAEQPLKWFEVLVTGVLYPLLTLVLGYIFGANNSSNNNNNPG